MKNTIQFLLLLVLLCSSPALHAQWIPQTEGIFSPFFSPDAHRAVDAQVNWAGINMYPWSSAPTLSAWITRTRDGGANWQYSQIPGAEGYVAWGISALDADQAWVSLNYRANRLKSRIYRTQDGGKTWQMQFEGLSAGFGVHFFDAQNGVMLRANRYRHTSDGGATWSVQDTFPTVAQGIFLVATEFFDAYRDTIWFPTADGKISKSTNKGKTWQTFSTAMSAAGLGTSELDFGDGRHGLAVSLFESTPDANGIFAALDYPRLYSTIDGGTTWKKVPNVNLPIPFNDISISSICAVPGLPGTYLMVAGYFDAAQQMSINKVYRSTDNGFTWAAFAPNPSLFRLQSLEFVSPNEGWGGSGGEIIPGAPYFFRWNGGSLVGTNEAAVDASVLQVMPNPAYGHLTLQLPEDVPAQHLTAFVLDAQGRLLLRSAAGIRTEMDIRHLPAGAYTALVENAKGKVVGVKRWVKGE